jgi:hypothetical protein
MYVDVQNVYAPWVSRGAWVVCLTLIWNIYKTGRMCDQILAKPPASFPMFDKKKM